MLKHRQYIYIYIFSRATLNETYTAKYDGVLPRTPEVRPKSEIYTPERDDEHLHPFHMRSPSPGDSVCQMDNNFLQKKSLFGYSTLSRLLCPLLKRSLAHLQDNWLLLVRVHLTLFIRQDKTRQELCLYYTQKKNFKKRQYYLCKVQAT